MMLPHPARLASFYVASSGSAPSSCYITLCPVAARVSPNLATCGLQGRSSCLCLDLDCSIVSASTRIDQFTFDFCVLGTAIPTDVRTYQY